ncbi:hypothetical protein SNOG_06679 [Parastagonospora nodorum SN15]|uniref:Cytochrome P450 n=1 Tax=Phaeosphaeria nodorum (strain SN15 / ATCC MYA-4574 / FGSC 10173) TaxID=321614 RepID=Q0UNI5_PHANO|nr:hypothetical protein SNOG_06679 [Parastagonospora nodorum SN15]EAT86510.2 hypothetical protein SNOG_06679 [Parastagonospora nodorum SN15]
MQSDFYVTLRPYTSGQALHAVFNTTEESILKQIKPPIAPLFNISSAATLEPLVDEVLECIRGRFDERFVGTGQIFDMGQWLQFFAFDVMGTMTFSKRYGFLDKGRDVGGMLGAIVDFMRTAAPAIKEKKEKMESKTSKSEGQIDFLTRYIELQKHNPSIPPWAPTAWTFSNVIAGSDSVGTCMRTMLYHLLAYPNTFDRLYKELLAAKTSRPFPSYSEVRELPYLEACVQEAIRVHPPFALPLERVVPDGGMTVLGYFLPGGTVIGGSPYVVNRDTSMFGEDAEFWRPERWLGGDAAHKRSLEASMLTVRASFGLLAVIALLTHNAVWCWTAYMSRATRRYSGNQETHSISGSDIRGKDLIYAVEERLLTVTDSTS